MPHVQVAEKLQRCTFQGIMSVRASFHNIPRSDEPQALAAALTTIAPLQAHIPELILSYLTMTRQRATMVADIAGWTALSLTRTTWPVPSGIKTKLPPLSVLELSESLGGTLLTDIVRCVPSVGELSVKYARLQSALPAGTQLPLRCMRVRGSVGMADLVKQVRMHTKCRFYRGTVQRALLYEGCACYSPELISAAMCLSVLCVCAVQVELVGGEVMWRIHGLQVAMTQDEVREDVTPP